MKKVVLVVGHSEVLQGVKNTKFFIGGAHSSEWTFNKKIANLIKDTNTNENIEYVIEYRDHDYEALPSEVNVHKADLVISMHCNAFNERVRGSEVLYYKKTKAGSDKVAEIMQSKLCDCMQNPDRGTKGRDYDPKRGIKERGAYLLKKVNAPCVICEPFFIDNNNEMDFALLNMGKLAVAYIQGIEESLEYLETLK